MKGSIAMQNIFAKRAMSAIRRTLRQFIDSKGNAIRGVAAIEFGIIGLILALMIIFTVDLGMGIYRKMQVQNSAQAGAQYAMVHGFNASLISSAVTNATTFSGISASPAPNQFCGCASSTGVASAACTSTCSGGFRSGTYVTVSAQGTYNTLFSYPLINDSFTFTAQSTVRIQ